MSKVTLLKSDGKDKLTFAKDVNGNYVTLMLPEGVNAPADKFDTTEGYKVVFSKSGDVYTLVLAEIKITGAYLNITENINVCYAVALPEGYTDPYMVFGFNGKTYKVTEYTEKDGKLIFKFLGVVPQMIGENIEATVYATHNGETVSDTKAEYSVRTYCVNMLGKTTDAKLIALLSDLLVYGAKSQIYNNPDIAETELVTYGVSGLAPSTFTAPTDTDKKLVGEADASVSWQGVALRYENAMAMRFTFKADANLVLKITIGNRTTEYKVSELKANEDTGVYTVYFRGILATEYDEVVTAAFYDGETQVGQSVTYSVNSYVHSMYESSTESLAALVQATYNYGVSAENYIEK